MPEKLSAAALSPFALVLAATLFTSSHACAQTAVADEATPPQRFSRIFETTSASSTGAQRRDSDSNSDLPDDAGSLPDAPGTPPQADRHPSQAGRYAPAGPYDRYIEPGQPAPLLTTRDKVVIALRDSVTPLAAAGWVASATFEQIVDGPPNYGESGTAYLQRVGAAAARGASQNIFSAAVFAPIFHQDPRFYKLGQGHPAATRVLYAASRTLITRGDNGRQQLNVSLLLGHLGGTSLTQAYYPPLNRGLRDLSHTYIESLVASSISFTLSEYLAETLGYLHLQSLHLR